MKDSKPRAGFAKRGIFAVVLTLPVAVVAKDHVTDALSRTATPGVDIAGSDNS